MSAAPILYDRKPTRRQAASTATLNPPLRVVSGALAQPRVIPGNRQIARKKARALNPALSFDSIAPYGIIFGICLLSAYISSGLVAGVEMESARQENLHFSQRQAQAYSAVGELRRTINQLGSADAIDNWATSNGFVPSYQISQDTKVDSSISKSNALSGSKGIENSSKI